MKPTERFAKSVSMPKIGFFALLSSPFRVGGSGASTNSRGSGARRAAWSLLLATVAAMTVTTAPALAKTAHLFSSSFSGSGASALSEPVGVAVNDETDDVYVVDKGHKRVEWFNSTGTKVEGEFNGNVGSPTGAFVSPEFIAEDNSGSGLDVSDHDVYVADTSDSVIDQFTAAGTYVGQLTGTCAKAGESPPACTGFVAFSGLHGVTVDGEGDVWVYETEAVAREGEIAEFSDTGAFVNARGTGHGAKSGIALDSSGHVFVVFGSGDVGEFEASTGTLLAKTENEDATGLATNPSSGRLFIDTGNQIEERGLTEPLSEPEKTFPAEGLSGSEGIAVSATGTVYAVQKGQGSVEVFDEDTFPEVSTQTVSQFAVHTVTLNGTVNPEGVEVTSCEFEYGATTAYGSTVACSPSPGSGNTPVTVSANLAGLSPATTYHYRLVVGNSEHASEATPDETFLTRGAGISEEQVTSVGETEATLGAKIDPNGSATTYHFEYDTSPYTTSVAHGTSLPVPDASIVSGTSPVLVSVQLNGLQPGSAYYYRVVAVSELEPGIFETFDGPGKTFTTIALLGSTSEACPNVKARGEQPYGLTLPDCRAYEMVSPLQKDDNGAVAVDSRAAVSGEAIAYYSPGSFENPKSAVLEGRYISRRSPSGWSTQNISPPYSDYLAYVAGPPFYELFFTPNLAKGIVQSHYTPLVEDEPPGYINVYVADTEDGSYQAVSRFTPEEEYKPFEEWPFSEDPQAEGASVDLSHVVFQQVRAEGSSRRQEHVYEWAGGEPSLVDVPPPGVKLEGGDNVGAPADIDLPVLFGDTWHAVSADGSRVFFTGQESAQYENVGQLFVREHPLAAQSPYVEGKCAVPADACTVEVSASQRSEPDPDASKAPWAFYRDASADGSRVFFTSKVELTNNANTGPEDNAANLYEYDLETGVLTDVTVPGTGAEKAESPEGAAVLGLVTASEDGSYVYFVANGVLAEGAKPGNCKKERSGEAVVAGERSCNLYFVHYDGAHWEAPRFITTLAGSNAVSFNFERGLDGDEADWVGDESPGAADNTDFGPGHHSVRVTLDGTRLVFESELSLTGYDNTPAESAKPGVCGEHDRCPEVYLYNATTGRLVCASCDPSGARPTGPAELGGHEQVTGSLTATFPFYLPSNLSENGGRLFFQSPDALVPNDSNGKLDVYEWEQPATAAEAEHGENSCTPTSSDFHPDDEGCVVPISDVSGGNESRFMDASADGDSAFIATSDQLLPSDTDTRVDVYDVRVGGGFPVTTLAPVCTNADSCKPPVSPQPGVFAVPASATFSGPGNPIALGLSPVVAKPVKKRAVKCKRNFVKKKIKKRETCVKKPEKKRKAENSTRRAG